jgi:hypothetical protein
LLLILLKCLAQNFYFPLTHLRRTLLKSTLVFRTCESSELTFCLSELNF